MLVSMAGVSIDSNENTGQSANPTLDEIATFPWKYIGYKDFTSFMATDPDFLALRRFDRLHTRVLLTKQAQLQGLEQQLDDMDTRCAAKFTKLSPDGLVENTNLSCQGRTVDLRDVNNGTVLDDLPQREELISKIQLKLSEYDAMLLKFVAVGKLFPAPKRNVNNIQSWLENNQGALADNEASFIEHRDELISVSEPKAVARQWFEDNVIYHTRQSLRLFQKNPVQSRLSDRDRQAIYTTDKSTIDAFGSVAVFIGAAIMLIAPLWILQTLNDLHLRLAVITAFLFACLVFMSFATLGGPFERLAVTAGYAAVLVVFLQNGQ